MPSQAELDNAAAILNSGKRVTLFCGVGCRSCPAEVLTLSERLQAPIVHTFRAKDIFDYGEGNVVGMTGLIGNPSGYHAVWDCDVLLMLGTDFPYDEFIPDGKKIIQVDRDVSHIGRRAPVSLGLVGTVKETVESLLERIDSAGDGDAGCS